MSPDEIVQWNQFVSALLLVVLVAIAFVWLFVDHCGPECQRCRPQSKRKH